MFVVEVVPMMRGASVESLTYYSGTEYAPGDLIDVPVRTKTVRALVVSSKAVSAAKTAVRAATFSLKKLPPQTDTKKLPRLLIETATALSKYYPAQLGALLFALLPTEMREGVVTIEDTRTGAPATTEAEVELMQAKASDRFIEYRSKIREVFAHRGSVVFVVPTAAHIDEAVTRLSPGIEERVVIFSPQLTKKRLAGAYEDFHDLTNAKLIITTPTHAYLDRHDITHIIVEECRSVHYQSRTRPYLNHCTALKTLAKTAGIALLLGDILPLCEDESRRRDEQYSTHGEYPKRLSLPAKLRVIEESEVTPGQPFALFSKKVLRAMENSLAEREHVFVYAARRGLAPVVLCIDCGFVFRDPDSGTPYSLFQTETKGTTERWFVSSASGRRIHAADTCEACGSWRLRERGIGIQYIERELKDLFPETPLFLFDHKSASTARRANQIISNFYDTKGAILLGTQMTLPYITKPVALSVVSSHDAARSIPSWRADEEFFALLLTLRERTEETVYLQTRTEPDTLINLAEQGAVERFYDEEIQLRHDLKYPPFSHFILLTWQDHRSNIEATETTIRSTLQDVTLRCYSGPESTTAKTRRHCLIRVPHETWPDPTLIAKLKTLPPHIRIEIDPQKIV